jgi:hypothetical protein
MHWLGFNTQRITVLRAACGGDTTKITAKHGRILVTTVG